MTTCMLCLGKGEVMVMAPDDRYKAPGHTYFTYAVCPCQEGATPPKSLCWRCKTPYCPTCTGARCPCAEIGINWDCICEDAPEEE